MGDKRTFTHVTLSLSRLCVIEGLLIAYTTEQGQIPVEGILITGKANFKPLLKRCSQKQERFR